MTDHDPLPFDDMPASTGGLVPGHTSRYTSFRFRDDAPKKPKKPRSQFQRMMDPFRPALRRVHIAWVNVQHG